jgi:hypothetical protein
MVTRDELLEAINRVSDKLDKHSDLDTANFNELKRIMLGDGEKIGIAGRLDRLEQKDARRTAQFAILWTSFLGFLAAVGSNYFK